jgi:hypothetical protein
MKKLFTFLFLFVAVASFGGMMHPAHAASAYTPAETAALQMQLDSLKAKLLELQAQQAATQASTPVASVTYQASSLSAEDLGSIANALSALATALIGLQAQFAANPQFAAEHAPVVLSALQGMGKTLTMIGTSIGAKSVASAGTPANSQPIAQGAPTAPAASVPVVAQAPVASPPLLATDGNNAAAVPETAQVVSSWSFKNLNWPLVIVGILILAAIALWLFWPGEDDSKKAMNMKKNVPSVPARPAPTAPSNIVMTSAKLSASPTPTPLVSSMAGSMERPMAPRK